MAKSAQDSQFVEAGDQMMILPGKVDRDLAAREAPHVQLLMNALQSKLSFRGTFQLQQSLVEIEIPHAVMQIFIEVMSQVAKGRPVSIVPASTELTTQQAADFLNVSRPYLVKILEQGEIPFSRVGTKRRVKFHDLIEFQSKDLKRRRKILDKMTADAQKLAKEIGDDY